jgi:hypothetical protein
LYGAVGGSTQGIQRSTGKVFAALGRSSAFTAASVDG